MLEPASGAGDEFKICVIVAYDEIATTKAYSADQATYRFFGHPAFLEWIRRVTRDEAYHFKNVMDVIGLRHRDQIPEIPRVVEEIRALDSTHTEYQGTFVLDHTRPLLTSEFLQECADLVSNYFSRR